MKYFRILLSLTTLLMVVACGNSSDDETLIGVFRMYNRDRHAVTLSFQQDGDYTLVVIREINQLNPIGELNAVTVANHLHPRWMDELAGSDAGPTRGFAGTVSRSVRTSGSHIIRDGNIEFTRDDGEVFTFPIEQTDYSLIINGNIFSRQ